VCVLLSVIKFIVHLRNSIVVNNIYSCNICLLLCIILYFAIVVYNIIRVFARNNYMYKIKNSVSLGIAFLNVVSKLTHTQ